MLAQGRSHRGAWIKICCGTARAMLLLCEACSFVELSKKRKALFLFDLADQIDHFNRRKSRVVSFVSGF